MKQIIMFFAAIQLFFGAKAQISLASTDMPVVGDTLRYSTTAADLLTLINQSGANQTWNASAIVPDFQDIAKYKTPSSISFLYLSSFGTSTYGAVSTSATNLGPLTGSDGYDFFKNSTGNFIQDGRGFSIQGLPLSQTWKDTVLRFPVNYGNSDSCKFISNEVNALIATTVHVGKRVNVVDGWGSITTPYGTFDCIRVKSTLRTVDTLKTTLLPIPIGIPQGTIEYKWYAKGKKIPVLEIDVPQGAGGGQATIRYRDGVRPEAFYDEASFRANKTSFMANTTDTCIINDNSLHTAVSRTWTITPNTFNFTGGTNATSQQAKIFFTAAGKYTVKLRVNYNAGADDTTIVEYITVGQGSLLKAGFTVSATSATTNTIISLTDTSKGSPTGWNWTFDPNTVTFMNSTSATTKNPFVKMTAEGFYAVTLSITDGTANDAVTKQNLILVLASGLNESHAERFKVYPNPVASLIYLQGEIVQADLLSITGQHMISSESGVISVELIPDGIYLLKASGKDGSTKMFRIQVQH